jgi:hypothetical protein
LGKVGLSFTLFDKTYALSCGFHRGAKGGPFSIKARFLYTSRLNRDAFEVLGIQLDKRRTLLFRLCGINDSFFSTAAINVVLILRPPRL